MKTYNLTVIWRASGNAIRSAPLTLRALDQAQAMEIAERVIKGDRRRRCLEIMSVACEEAPPISAAVAQRSDGAPAWRSAPPRLRQSEVDARRAWASPSVRAAKEVP